MASQYATSHSFSCMLHLHLHHLHHHPHPNPHPFEHHVHDEALLWYLHWVPRTPCRPNEIPVVPKAPLWEFLKIQCHTVSSVGKEWRKFGKMQYIYAHVYQISWLAKRCLRFIGSHLMFSTFYHIFTITSITINNQIFLLTSKTFYSAMELLEYRFHLAFVIFA